MRFGCILREIVSIGLDEFGRVLLKAAEVRKGLPITIVFEVERTSTSLAVLLLIKNFAEYFAVYASVTIVLSEANAGLAIGDDERHEIVWVDEMNAEEAEEYAKKLHPVNILCLRKRSQIRRSLKTSSSTSLAKTLQSSIYISHMT
jgi:hypothetical protein